MNSDLLFSGKVYKDADGDLYQIITVAEDADSFASDKKIIFQKLFGDFKVYAMNELRFNEKYKLVCSPSEGSSSASYSHSSDSSSCSSNPSAPDYAKKSFLIHGAKNDRLDAPDKNSGLMQFLDAESYEEKLDVFKKLHDSMDQHTLNAIAVSLDMALPEGDIEKQYDSILYCLTTHRRFETTRLR